MKNKLKYSLYIFVFLFTVMFSFCMNSIFAAENEYKISSIFDIKAFEGIYKYSSDNDEIYLPFVRYALGRITVDKEISKMGVSFTSSTIDVNAPMKAIQVLFARDSIRVNNEMEYAIIYSTGDVVIDSTISKSAIIFSSGTITITENATINEDLICFGSKLNIKGKVNGSVINTSDNLELSGSINKDLRCYINEMNLDENTEILGNIYIKTYNKNLNLPEKFKNATIDILEVQSENIWDIILNILVDSIILVILYIVLNKITKEKMFDKMLNVTKYHPVFIILSGSIILLSIPAIAFIIIILLLLQLWIIAIPITILYVGFLIIVLMLSKFFVGNVIYKYMKEKYFKDISKAYSTISLLVIYICLFSICKIPLIGDYINIAIAMLSVGITFTSIFRKNNKGLQNSKKEINKK